MADMKSCEGKITTLECMECGCRETFTERQFTFTDGLRCGICSGPVKPVATKPGEEVNNRRLNKGPKKKISVGTITVDIDVSNAIKGLKAVQREAKKATRALKEVEEMKLKYRGNE
ncbi:hypothetical protein AWH56_005205 [Anaerobacillus isosaccharinicus]|uniref:Uncharacterized protein n=1 Tax=Anaerobacillus isosaccharinicus TaxID=1532552 RepID=A0A1S2L9K1_9BACI|nr:hypothetical protein [Anaerobacillus isosaccharinicus]MBA5584576.1 hypothetical protein [Anaerobacillus isosaccharinicus]QOY38790.1 hypothetical protein AWH56_005205 [Anaerobacillus isosaccharinicus]